ncbi:hypothetical protein ABIE13_003263 [Ottowia thiooxydans]|uniref:Uncharacterized protein n=1 Tax=Ottowia thiooxydans TaxID=219182 RepID=A0ABV2QAT6_9BURK
MSFKTQGEALALRNAGTNKKAPSDEHSRPDCRTLKKVWLQNGMSSSMSSKPDDGLEAGAGARGAAAGA